MSKQLTPIELAVLQVLWSLEVDGRRYAPNRKRDAERMEIWKADGRERHHRAHEAGEISKGEMVKRLKNLDATTLDEFTGPTLAGFRGKSGDPPGRLRLKVTPEALIRLEFQYLPPHVDARLCWPADESRSSALDRAMQLLVKREFTVEAECPVLREASYYRLSEGIVHCELTWTAEGQLQAWKTDLEVPMREHIRSACRSHDEASRRKAVESLSQPEELLRCPSAWEHLARRRKTDYQITSAGLKAIEGEPIILSLEEPETQDVNTGADDAKGRAQAKINTSTDPPPGYVGVKTVELDKRFRKCGKNPPRSTIQDWEERANNNPDRSKHVEAWTDPASREKHYPSTWIEERIRHWNPRQNRNSEP